LIKENLAHTTEIVVAETVEEIKFGHVERKLSFTDVITVNAGHFNQ